MFRISELARQFGLSRSTLLYYDRIGLLPPTGRSEAGYRLYSKEDRVRLSDICRFRKAGLALEDVQQLLSLSEKDSAGAVLKKRLQDIGEEIETLQSQQRLIAKMLKVQSQGELPVDKHAWIEMLRAAGMDDRAMMKWHSEFERRAPESHHRFLLSLGIQEDEVLQIRKWSAKASP